MGNSSSATCAYEYEVLTTTEPDDRIDVTRPQIKPCPHDVSDPTDGRCLFHHGDGNFPSSRFTDEFRKILADERIPPNFFGGNLNGLQLDSELVTTPSGDPIDLRGVTIHGDLDLTDATVEVPLLLDEAAITGSVIADGAEFQAPVSLVGTDIQKRVYMHDTTVADGIVANDLNAGYVDGRDLTVTGPLILDRATFGANLKLARATVEGDLSLEHVQLDHSLDATGLSVAGNFVASEASIDSSMDQVAATIDGDVDVRKLHVGGETDWSHMTIGGDVTVTDCRFDSQADFEDITIGGEQASFDGTQFGGKADFTTLELPDGRVSFSDVTFDGEAWFVYARIGDEADFSGATFRDMAHLRDATFETDLILRNVSTTGQAFLHQSTIHGDCDCSDATFEHFQFSATVHGKTDFSRARFVEKALFMKSEFGDRVWFDEASFAGHPDFTDARFTGETTFDDTEFLVEPTFEGTRFAVDPNLDTATYPTDASVDLTERRKSMILAHPETLQYEGEQLPAAALTGDFVVPAGVSHLVEDDLTQTKIVTTALTELDSSEWHSLFEESLRTARTAVGQLPENGESVLVFSLQVNPDAELGGAFFESATIAGVYTRDSSGVTFGHLNLELSDADYLIPIPADDEAFEAGASVATRSELQKAMIRNQLFRAAVLGKRDDDESSINSGVVPVLVAAGKVGK